MELSRRIENILIIAVITILFIINAVIIIFGLHTTTENLANLLTTGHIKTLLDFSVFLVSFVGLVLAMIALSSARYGCTSTLGLTIILAISFVMSAFIPSVVLVAPVNHTIFDSAGSKIQSKYLKTNTVITSRTFEKIDGDTFIVNGHKYRVNNTRNVKTKYVNSDQNTGIKIYRSNIDQKKMPKSYVNYLNFLAKSSSYDGNPLPSANQSKYTKVVITQSLRK